MNPADAYDGETNLRKPSESYVLFQSGIPFWLPPGDGGSNGLNFTGTRGVFTLSAAAPLQHAAAFTRNCYCYLPAGAGGLVAGGLFWCEMSDDTNGEIFQQTYSGSGQPTFVTSPTPHPNLAAGRITQTLSEVVACSGVVPGGSMGPNGIFRAIFAFRQTNSATTKGVRIKFGANTIGASSGTTSGCVADYESWAQNQGTTAKYSKVSGNVSRAHSSTTAMNSSDYLTTVQDTSVDVPFSGVMYLGATTDSVILVFRKASVEYGA
jgi:hypothetical protein